MSRLLRFAVVTAVAGFVTTSLLLAQSPSGQLRIVALESLFSPIGSALGDLAFGINDRGQVVGWSPTLNLRAVLWENGTPTDLGTLPGATSMVAYGINSRGQIVGYSAMSTGPTRAVLWTR